MIMDKCGCRGNNPIEGYANMNECLRGWAKSDGLVDMSDTRCSANGSRNIQPEYDVEGTMFTDAKLLRDTGSGRINKAYSFQDSDNTNKWVWFRDYRGQHEYEPLDNDWQSSCYKNLQDKCQTMIDSSDSSDS
jgi:hypothetical protein